jgi:UDP-glucose 4-epimerase
MILITGGGGFLGLNIARCLADRGHELLLVQRRPVPPQRILAPYWDKQIRQASGNVLDNSFLLSVIREYQVESIVHGAFDTSGIATPETLKSELPRVLRVELEGSLNVLEAARSAGLRRVTFISSLDCYRGWPQECPVWQEDACLPPLSGSPIGSTKRAVEQMGFIFMNTYKLSFASLRVGRVYGPAASHRGPMREMIESAAAGRPVEFCGAQAATRSHTVYAKDVGAAAALVHLAASLSHCIYNVSDGTNPTLVEIARVVRELVPDSRITLGPAQPAPSPQHDGVDVSRMKAEFGFACRSLKAGIGDYLTWLREGAY